MPHPQLPQVADESRALGLPLTNPDTGALLHTLVLATGASRILEVGTGLGSATLWLATAMPAEGRMISMEVDPDRAARARAHLDAAGLAGRVSVMVGDATRFLHKVAGPFDLVYQDSDPALYARMHDRLVSLLRPRGLLVTARAMAMDDDPRVCTTCLRVGDGVCLSVKVSA